MPPKSSSAAGPITKYLDTTASIIPSLSAAVSSIRRPWVKRVRAAIKAVDEIRQNRADALDEQSPDFLKMQKTVAFLEGVVGVANEKWLSIESESLRVAVLGFLERVKQSPTDTQPPPDLPKENTPLSLTLTVFTIKALDNAKFASSLALASYEFENLDGTKQRRSICQAVKACSGSHIPHKDGHLYPYVHDIIIWDDYNVYRLLQIGNGVRLERGGTLHIVARPRAFTMIAIGYRAHLPKRGPIMVLEPEANLNSIIERLATAPDTKGALYRFDGNVPIEVDEWAGELKNSLFECAYYLIPRKATSVL